MWPNVLKGHSSSLKKLDYQDNEGHDQQQVD
jgi:hypothetical protein